MKTFHIGGVLMLDGSNNPFPHDGEGKPGHSCTGYGCDCDEKIMVIILVVVHLVAVAMGQQYF